MALFRKKHSRSKPVIETTNISAGATYVDGEKRYTADMPAPGGPPYTYFEFQITESEMLMLATAWLSSFAADNARKLRKQAERT